MTLLLFALITIYFLLCNTIYTYKTNTSKHLLACNINKASLYEVERCLCNLVKNRTLDISHLAKNNNHLIERYIKEYVSMRTPSKSVVTLRLLHQHPCVIQQLSEMFASHEFTIIASKRTKNLGESIIACEPSQPINQFLLPNNINATDLQQKILSWKTTGIKTYVVLCSLECTAMVLHIAYGLGLGSKDYVWIIYQPNAVVTSEMAPANLLSLIHAYKNDTGVIYLKNFTQELSCETLINKTITSNHVDDLLPPTNNDLISLSPNIFDIIIKNAKHQWSSIATWNSKSFTWKANARAKLKDFKNHEHFVHLRVVTVLDPPFTSIHQSSAYDEHAKKCHTGQLCWKFESANNETNKKKIPYCCVGFCMDLLEYFVKDMHITTDVYLVQDNNYGAIVNGTWVGMVGDVYYDKADFAIAALTITAQRSDVIDYTTPYMIGGAGMGTIAKKQLIPFLNIEAFRPLSGLLWLTIFLILVAVSIMLVLTEKYGSYRQKSKYAWSESITYLFGLMFQRDIGGINPKNFSSRTVSIALAIVMMVIMSTYTAVLTANKVTHKSVLPITGFSDVKVTHPTTAFIYATVGNSSFTQMFHDSTDPNWNRMYSFMKPYNFKNTSAAFEKLKSGELNGLIHDYPVILHYIAKDPECSIQFAGEPIKDAGFGIAVRKGSLIKKAMTELIWKYQGDGTIDKLKIKWLSSACALNGNAAIVEQIGIQYFGGLFTIILGWSVVSFILFLIETFIHKLYARRTFVLTQVA